MAKKTAAELKAEQAVEIQKVYEDEIKDVTKAAEKAREDAPDVAETEEEYRDRIANVPGIFGDTDTTAGVGAAGTDVISANNELATVAVAETEAAAEQGDEDAADATPDEARRQVDIAGGQPSAEEVDANAPERDDNDNGGLFGSTSRSNDNDVSHDVSTDRGTAEEVSDRIEAASTVAEVDALAKGDERKTVKRAADKRKGELK